MTGDTPDRRDDGRFRPQVSDEELLAAVLEHQPAGTAEIGEAVGLARQNADYRLRQLDERGAVDRHKIGGALVWMVDDEDPDDEEPDDQDSTDLRA